ncbi:MAG: hypothetical protein MJZ12_00415 [Prevotella sp.]|nr:hypothetical protein [Prevotella sp.]
MAEETIQIIRIETGEAVKSVNDLRENVKILKDRLGDLEIGTTEYQDTLEELKVNQAAVKDAMYATTASMDDLTKSATGTSNSYNSLVHRMASLKEELRATDVSTQQGKERFKELAAQINEVNNTLKDMDALQGNFQRNVGNYPGLMKTFSGSLDALDKGIKASSGDLGKLKNGFDALAVNPAFAILGLVVALFGSLADTLKEDETTMAAVNKAGVSLEPVFKLLKGILERVATIVADLITKVSAFVQSNGLIPKIIDGVVGVGNAILKFVIAPFKGVIEAIKIFKEQGVKGLGDAARAFANEMKTGLSFKSNYQAGEAIVDAIIAGVQDKKETAKATAAEVGKEVGKELGYNVQKEFEKALALAEKKFDEDLRRRQQEQKELDDMTEAALAETNAEIEKYFEEQERMRQMDLKDAQEKAKAKIQTIYAVANATSSVLGSIADMYESDEKNSEKNANKIKGLRIASATIDTISGAVGAFMQAVQTMPPPFGAIVGGVQAAAVTAAGIAQIAKIKSTKVSGSASNPAPTAPAVTSAPTRTMDIQQVRSVTSASEEDRLNQMASDQRVVLVMSDLEVKQNQSKVQVAEASF